MSQPNVIKEVARGDSTPQPQRQPSGDCQQLFPRTAGGRRVQRARPAAPASAPALHARGGRVALPGLHQLGRPGDVAARAPPLHLGGDAGRAADGLQPAASGPAGRRLGGDDARAAGATRRQPDAEHAGGERRQRAGGSAGARRGSVRARRQQGHRAEELGRRRAADSRHDQPRERNRRGDGLLRQRPGRALPPRTAADGGGGRVSATLAAALAAALARQLGRRRRRDLGRAGRRAAVPRRLHATAGRRFPEGAAATLRGWVAGQRSGPIAAQDTEPARSRRNQPVAGGVQVRHHGQLHEHAGVAPAARRGPKQL